MSSDSKSDKPSSTIPVSALVDPNAVQLYVNNLSFETTEETLSTWFQTKLGTKPLEVKIVVRKFRNSNTTRSRGYGFIQVHKDKLKAALDLNKAKMGEREIGVVEAKQRSDEERAELQKQRDARREEIRKRVAEREPRERKSREGEQKERKERAPREDKENEKEAEPKKTFENATQLYVNNLPFSVSMDQIDRMFESKTGQKPLEVDMVKSRFGKYKGASRGFGFVTVKNEVVQKALELNGTKVEDRDIGVQIAKPKEERPANARPRRSRGPKTSTSTDENGTSNGNAAEGEKARRPRGRGRGRGRGGARRSSGAKKEGGATEGSAPAAAK